MSAGESTQPDHSVRVRIAREELVINNKYEALSIANDLLVGVFFLAGSILFLFKISETAAQLMYLLGSIDFALRPLIRIARRTHLRRVGAENSNGTYDY